MSDFGKRAEERKAAQVEKIEREVKEEKDRVGRAQATSSGIATHFGGKYPFDHSIHGETINLTRADEELLIVAENDGKYKLHRKSKNPQRQAILDAAYRSEFSVSEDEMMDKVSEWFR